MEIQTKVGVHNEFTIEVRDKETGKLKQVGKAYNIVLSAGFSRIMNFQTYFVNIHFGTGSGSLTPSRTSLFAHLGTRAATIVEQVKGIPISYVKEKIVLNPEEFVGQNLTEVGVAYGTANTHLCTHATIEDSEGNPISILKTDLDVITIYATVFLILESPYSDVKFSFIKDRNQDNYSNSLIDYFLTGSFPTMYFFAGEYLYDKSDLPSEFWPAYGDYDLGINAVSRTPRGIATISTTAWIKDLAARKVTSPVYRLGITEWNMPVCNFGLGSQMNADFKKGVFTVLLPFTGVYSGKDIINESIGVGDGVNTKFNVKWPWFLEDSLEIFVDGVKKTKGADYIVPFLGKGNTPENPTIHPLFTVTASSTGTSNAPSTFIIDTMVDTKTEQKRKFSNTLRRLEFTQETDRISRMDWEGSDDLINWDKILVNVSPTSGFNGLNMPPNTKYRYYRAWVITTFKFSVNGGNFRWDNIALYKGDEDVNIVFINPPPNGVPVGANYRVPYIPKDANHVLDIQFSIQYGEV